ncbi:aldo/keto reductase [Thiobaca trueperi]|uniref:Aryl-alcohol dehydrogenase-like predicted oxidoreductase n=1 Tax=Thiobaca trueperi TaxID=127458 RepID=A0A4R3MTV8_9GAMM|nr:aldo/keto reductase [Thiobaca trueperi]TCT18701.1 aryl-alcohol dehydrogenase-like predicted oxidoreductase [Thiobaca trueperi]
MIENKGSEITSPIGIGCAYLTDGSFTRHEDRLIRAAFDTGARHFDVAPSYGLGTAEHVLGRALGSTLRGEVRIFSKAGINRPKVNRLKLVLRGALAPLRDHIRGSRLSKTAIRLSAPKRQVDFAPKAIARSLDSSLSELRTDYLDGFLLHMIAREDLTDELLRVMERAREEGKTRKIGLATSRAETSRIFQDIPDFFDVEQTEWVVLHAPLPAYPSGSGERILHGVLGRTLATLTEQFAADPARTRQIAEACGADIADPRVLSQALIGAAITENRGGLVLLASRSIPRTVENLKLGQSPQTAALGAAFLAAVHAAGMVQTMRAQDL